MERLVGSPCQDGCELRGGYDTLFSMTSAALPLDPGPAPPENATPKQREQWRRDNERFLTEGFKPGTSDQPVAAISATDRRIQALRRDHDKFLEQANPMRASIWLALLRPSATVIHDAEMMKRYRDSQAGRSAGEHTAPPNPAIIDIGNQLVANALAGDTASIERIAERIEGRAGLRRGDEEEDSPGRRKQTQDITERVVAALTSRRLEAVPKTANIVDVEAELVLDNSKDSA